MPMIGNQGAVVTVQLSPSMMIGGLSLFHGQGCVLHLCMNSSSSAFLRPSTYIPTIDPFRFHSFICTSSFNYILHSFYYNTTCVPSYDAINACIWSDYTILLKWFMLSTSTFCAPSPLPDYVRYNYGHVLYDDVMVEWCSHQLNTVRYHIHSDTDLYVHIVCM